MSRFDRYKKGVITIEIQAHSPERFVNLLWKNGVLIKNVQKINITTLRMDINLRDFSMVRELTHKFKISMRVIDRKGFTFFLLRMRNRVALTGGIGIFALLLLYLSGFIWKVDIKTDGNLTPYEIRQELNNFGIVPGIRKSNLNIYQLQEKMIKTNDNLMYLKAQVEGSRLLISAIEKVPPPSVVADNVPCNLTAKKDGQIFRIFTSAGTSVVKNGDMVRSGQLLVKGEQGKEGSVYQVHAKGEVFARTYYDAIKEVPVKGVKVERTGNVIQNYYIELFGKRIYFKNSLNKFKSCDKIVENSNLIKKEIYYETRETKYLLDTAKVVDETASELYSKMVQNFDKSVKVVDKKVISEPNGDSYKVRVLITAEENIANTEKIQ